MILDLYMFLAAIAVVFMILTFVKKDNIVFGWLSFILLSSIAMLSAQIEIPICSGGSCAFESVSYTALIWMWSGLSIIMLIYAIYDTITLAMGTVEEATEGKKKDRERPI